MRSLSSWLAGRDGGRRSRGASRRRRRPEIEALEGRVVLSTYFVNSFGDSPFVSAGMVTLRSAIQAADSHGAGDDTIILPAGSYQLTRGQIEINHPLGNLTIKADPFSSSPFAPTINAGGNGRAFLVDAAQGTSTLNLENLVIINGKATSGGAIQTSMNLVVSGCSLNNHSASSGGAIAVLAGKTTLKNSGFSNDSASGAGGAVLCKPSASLALVNDTFQYDSASAGGALFLTELSAATIDSCTFTSNSASVMGGAVANDGNLTINSATITQNTAGIGGGIANELSAVVTIQHAVITNNTALSGGGIDNRGSGKVNVIGDCSVAGNTATVQGGGINNVEHGVLAFSGLIWANSAPTGGGLANGGFAVSTLTACAVKGNSAQLGGGVVNSDHGQIKAPAGSGDKFTFNTATEVGGAFYNRDSAVADLLGCLFDSNHAELGGGASSDNLAVLNVTSCTFTNNTASRGGAIAAASRVTAVSCIFQKNSATRYGGAIDFDSYGALQVWNSSFLSNSAGLNGGAICVTQEGASPPDCILLGDVFQGNTPDDVFTMGPEL